MLDFTPEGMHQRLDLQLYIDLLSVLEIIAVNTSLLPLIVMVAVVFSSSASAICEAMVRFQIKSYSFFSCAVPSTDWFSI